MGGKRPDQYRIDPRDSQATDYKTRPRDKSDVRPDKELYGRVMKGSVKKAQPVPPETLEPDTARAREEELERQRHVQEEGE